MAAPLVEIENDFSRPCTIQEVSHDSLENQKQSSQTTKEVTVHQRYFIRASMLKASEQATAEPKQRTNDSTLLNNNEQRSRENINGNVGYFLKEHQKLSQRPGTTRGAPMKSPMQH